MTKNDRKIIHGVMILNEINVEAALYLTGEKFNSINDKIDEVRQILLEEVFPSNPMPELNWSDVSST